MNILVYCDEELSVAGGGSRQVVEFVRALAARSHAVRVVAPKPRRQVARFHRELVRKQALMANRRYRYMKLRKATLELRGYVMRYVRWFVVRILRVKSISGQRREIPRERLSVFR